MRLRCVSFIALALSAGLSAQPRAWSFEGYGPGRIQLEGLYAAAIGGDGAVFADGEEDFIAAWQGFLQAIGQHLKDGGFVWGRPARCFLRVYFDACGMVDRLLYAFPEDAVTKEQAARFHALLNGFLAENAFPLSAMEPFRQCGPALFTDPGP
jgi:hypothetical protein